MARARYHALPPNGGHQPRAERGHQALDAWAGLVRVALARQDTAAVLTYTNEILARLDAQTFYDSDDPSAIYLLCAQALEMQNDARAREILERGDFNRPLQTPPGAGVLPLVYGIGGKLP